MEHGSKIGLVASRISGEILYDSICRRLHKKLAASFVESSILRRLGPIEQKIFYIVLFSPGEMPGEIRCQIDWQAGATEGFALGYGHRPNHAFNDAMERLQWHTQSKLAA